MVCPCGYQWHVCLMVIVAHRWVILPAKKDFLSRIEAGDVSSHCPTLESPRTAPLR